MIQLWWGVAERKFDSIVDLDQALDQLHEEHLAKDGIIIEIRVFPSGNCLSIGLGRETTVLNFVQTDRQPPYFISVVKAPSNNTQPLVFFFDGSWTEYSAQNGVPISDARVAVRQFISTGGSLPNSVNWKEI